MTRPSVSASRAGMAGWKRIDIGQTKPLDLGMQGVALGTVADQRCRDSAATAMQLRDGVDQDVDAFDRPEFAQEHQIAWRPARAMTGSNSLRETPLCTTRTRPRGVADLAAENRRR